MALFQHRDLIGHSGDPLDFKIDCDALTDEDIDCCAWLISQRVGEFTHVEGVPTGGIRLATALERYAAPPFGPDRPLLAARFNTLLIVDDVLTTGTSMEEQRGDREAIGAVIFSRTFHYPQWITPLFVMQ